MSFGALMAAFRPTFVAMFCAQDVTIEQRTEGPLNDLGRPTGQWATYWAGKAAVEPISGTEANVAAQPTPQIVHRVTLAEFVEGVNSQMRVVLTGGRILNIVSVIDSNSAGVFLEIQCVEGSERE